MNQEAVVELHPEELQLSADEDDSDGGHGDHDKGLKIRRTVTQVRSRRCARPHPCICCSHSNSHFERLVIIFFPFFLLFCQVVPSDGQENGQTNQEDEAEPAVKDEQRRTSRESRRDSVCEEAAEPQPAVSTDGETTKKGASMGGQAMCS